MSRARILEKACSLPKPTFYSKNNMMVTSMVSKGSCFNRVAGFGSGLGLSLSTKILVFSRIAMILLGKKENKLNRSSVQTKTTINCMKFMQTTWLKPSYISESPEKRAVLLLAAQRHWFCMSQARSLILRSLLNFRPFSFLF